MATELDTQRGIVRVPTGTWTIDPAHSSVEFRIKHMMISTVRGRFSEFEGTIQAAPDYHDSKVRGTIKAASIDTNESNRDAHLRSADFFDTEQHNALSYKSTGVRYDDEEGFVIDGELTLRGVTKEVPLQLEIHGFQQSTPFGDTRTGFTATGEIDRRDFGVSFNMALEGGGVGLGNKVQITLEIEAVFQAEPEA